MNNRKAFTLVELLTTLVIIALLVGILLPSIAAVRRIARQTAQKAQFTSIDMALLAFKQDYGDYPNSTWPDSSRVPPDSINYCGAQKLAEALVGLDLMGFHPKSAWRADGWNDAGERVYDSTEPNIQERRGPYLEVATASAFLVGDLFNVYSPLDPCTFVLCDVFHVRKVTDAAGKTVTAGAPILYYKANTASKNITPPPSDSQIYNYLHNKPLVDLGKLTTTGAGGQPHPLGYDDDTDCPVFYSDKYSSLPVATYGTNTGYGIRDPKVAYPWPYRPDSYILISAGNDGLYGTADDIHNY